MLALLLINQPLWLSKIKRVIIAKIALTVERMPNSDLSRSRAQDVFQVYFAVDPPVKGIRGGATGVNIFTHKTGVIALPFDAVFVRRLI